MDSMPLHGHTDPHLLRCQARAAKPGTQHAASRATNCVYRHIPCRGIPEGEIPTPASETTLLGSPLWVLGGFPQVLMFRTLTTSFAISSFAASTTCTIKTARIQFFRAATEMNLSRVDHLVDAELIKAMLRMKIYVCSGRRATQPSGLHKRIPGATS